MPETATKQLSICTLQPSLVWEEPERNFDTIAGLLDRASLQQTLDLVVLPEHFSAAPADDEDNSAWLAAQAFAAGLARRHEINLVAGSAERWLEGRGHRVNTCVVYDRQGQPLGHYDKRQLFGFEKRRQVQPGATSLAVEVDGVRLGVLICADLWYPELVRELAGSIDVLCVPSQTTIRPEADPAYARLLWHSLAMTRAQENVLALAVSDQAATSQAPYRCGGVASITDPSAEPDLGAIQQVIDDGSQGYRLATVDLERLATFRAYRRQNGLLPS